MQKSLAKQHHISQAIVDYLHNTIVDLDQLKEILEAISLPPKFYSFRVNLNKISIESLIKFCKKQFPGVKCIQGSLENILQIPVIENDGFPLLSKQIFTDKFAAEAVMMGADLFIPGFRGTTKKFNKGDNVSILLGPSQIPQNLKKKNLVFHVANGETMISSKDLPKYVKGILVKTIKSKFSIINYHSSSLYENGWISDQTFPATVASKLFVEEILKNKEKEIENPLILDTCSAPGHKTTAIAEWGHWLYSQQGKQKWLKIISIDRSTKRLEHLRYDINRLSLQNIQIIPIRLEKILKKMPELKEKADYLLFDPPCSALGTRPKLFLEKSSEILMDYSQNQRRLLKIVDQLVKPGGILMYNTCTIPKEENEGIVAYAVEKLGYKILPIPKFYYKFGNPGIEYKNLSKNESQNLLRFYPQRHENMGYFIAMLRKY